LSAPKFNILIQRLEQRTGKQGTTRAKQLLDLYNIDEIRLALKYHMAKSKCHCGKTLKGTAKQCIQCQ
jgi:hypothetical protein